MHVSYNGGDPLSCQHLFEFNDLHEGIIETVSKQRLTDDMKTWIHGHVASRNRLNATKVERCPRRARKVSGRQVSAGEERTRGTDVHRAEREELARPRVDNLPLL
ncbi:hypothetical protein X777_09877 [Ooceraea biroi]|uniref:Uncharacterized protein n=1 Tax=Ooceraea biroi TaxID=2015173 RepID=A0A026W544_OOCBI|nr:hypothetical protein X777_09877 [Ooceraea biroi]